MRITGNRIMDMAASNTARNQETVAARANEVSSGLRVAKPSDDPSAWSAAERAKLRKSLAEGSGKAVQVGREQLVETDAALATIGDVVSQARSLAVQGANATYNATDRAEIGAQVRALYTAALAAANRQSANGEYLLAGSASLAAPFDAAGTYVGDGNGRQIPAGEGVLQMSTLPGSYLTASRGVDVLPLLARVATALDTNDLAALRTGLGELETAVTQVASARTVTGGAMGVLDATIEARDALATHLSSEISRNVESDTISAASELAKASQSLEASRAVTSHIVALLDPSR